MKNSTPLNSNISKWDKGCFFTCLEDVVSITRVVWVLLSEWQIHLVQSSSTQGLGGKPHLGLVSASCLQPTCNLLWVSGHTLSNIPCTSSGIHLFEKLLKVYHGYTQVTEPDDQSTPGLSDKGPQPAVRIQHENWGKHSWNFPLPLLLLKSVFTCVLWQ